MSKDYEEIKLNNAEEVQGLMYALDLANFGVIAPHKMKYYNRYNMNWLSSRVDSGEKLNFVTFWKADKGEENRMFSQWYQGEPFVVNGRTYYTAEQYMMSEKALLFKDYARYDQIMREKDPAKCKQIGGDVENFDGKVWGKAAREVLFHGNLGKLQADIVLVDALLKTGDAVLIEASPYDGIYGSGIKKDDLLSPDGTLKVHPKDWLNPKDPTKQSENKLGFVLMGVRDLFNDLFKAKIGDRLNPLG